MGNLKQTREFTSSQIDSNLTSINEHLKSRSHLRQAKVFLVPGPNDPAIAHVYPKYPLSFVSKQTMESLPDFQFVSNPFRLVIEQKEITFFRENLQKQVILNLSTCN